MNSKGPSSNAIRGFGQRSISSSSSFAFRSQSADANSKESKGDVQAKSSKKNSYISLSEFLDRKLEKTSKPAKTVQGKQSPFSSLVGGGNDANGSTAERVEVRKGGDADNGFLGEAVFEQFKCARKDKEDCEDSCKGGEVVGSTTIDEQESRKRKNPFEFSSEDNKQRGNRRYLVVLGDEPKPKQKRREQSFIRNEKSSHLFNHYANGSGWWDCNMEGVDSEVGCREIWEGMGSTTLGGLEWH
ncbi:PREDICTED: uncharacterized protein LOC104609607 [Nelumbo nucifera]|uniref:Uncharacterized protein LOC104609607 n=2 Tax=Nelumbo nucifera TaxID=4432 RepID=A0A1U8BCG4_NELNU|nr:PREDICTED: uncharacterized protein LOC104609607 [Nelumbo nucifera]DAD36608.1 TPA_asm: hypothetical protein HUJ06_007249 [Nelumbo nucifera]